MDWGVAEAKQQLSRVLRAAREEPQIIRTRGELVGAVLGPDDAEAYLAWKKTERRASLAALFEEGRRICAEEGIELTLPPRVDRPSSMLARRAGPPPKKKPRAR